MQRADGIAAHDRGFRLSCSSPRVVGTDCNERVQDRLRRVDPSQRGL